MKPTSFKESNIVMGAGGNPNTVDLVACVAKDIYNRPYIISRWKLEPDEYQKIIETGEIWIGIMGTGMPPVCPMVHNPFLTHGFEPLKIEKSDGDNL